MTATALAQNNYLRGFVFNKENFPEAKQQYYNNLKQIVEFQMDQVNDEWFLFLSQGKLYQDGEKLNSSRTDFIGEDHTSDNNGVPSNLFIADYLFDNFLEMYIGVFEENILNDAQELVDHTAEEVNRLKNLEAAQKEDYEGFHHVVSSFFFDKYNQLINLYCFSAFNKLDYFSDILNTFILVMIYISIG
eukprot:CAMPEP_0170526014 /NCGR_PEP_ID=MMETSP0209-20121228/11481_1 /TAXON_ID=665100 ORGANISM="Litonotus pictus, Strain P1" /NCGR_SAMPLE_ID=MMETSP0209 /ASSEMBLY_ACC=CAM_ASM_000301 /LENGTH=188 /DNA_ID=CAMNT_0010815617 /DNA_START=139 /DNA_END=701 /DNA_ORIENTATION=-